MLTRQFTVEDVLAELARRRLPLYKFAALIGLHPARLSRVLNAHEPLSSSLAERIRRALDTARDREAKD